MSVFPKKSLSRVVSLDGVSQRPGTDVVSCLATEPETCGLRPTRVYDIEGIAEVLQQPASQPDVTTGQARAGIHVPWAKSYVVAVADTLRIVEKHSTGLVVANDYHVWERGIDSWRNLGAAYAKTMNGQLAWPDVTDLLDPAPDEQKDDQL